MSAHQMEMTKRLTAELSLKAFKGFLETVLDQIGFDEATVFDAVLEEENGHRMEYELQREALLGLIQEDQWPQIHKVLLSNQWMKGMNFKLHWIKRMQGSTLMIKWETTQSSTIKSTGAALEEALNALEWTTHSAAAECAPQIEERERLFGAMLLTESVAARAKEPFLNGDFLGSLSAAYGILIGRLEELLGAHLERWEDLEIMFYQEPPCFLLPDLSGQRLQLELAAIARLWSGLELLLQPLLRGAEKAPEDPAGVLKKLVMISFLVERLEAAVPNPARVRKNTRVPQKRKVKKTRRTTTRIKKVIKKVKSGKPKIKKRKPRKA
jgi:hypothetical protein